MTRALRQLAELERRWDARPSVPPPGWNPPAPQWAHSSPKHAPLFAPDRVLWERGRPTWGCVLMANQAAWVEDRVDVPGEVLWSDDTYYARFPERLEAVREAYWRLRHDPVSPARGLAALADFTRDESRGAGISRFPPLLCFGRVVWHAVFAVHRTHLPAGRLQESLLPFLTVPDRSHPVVRVLPKEFWVA